MSDFEGEYGEIGFPARAKQNKALAFVFLNTPLTEKSNMDATVV